MLSVQVCDHFLGARDRLLDDIMVASSELVQACGIEEEEAATLLGRAELLASEVSAHVDLWDGADTDLGEAYAAAITVAGPDSAARIGDRQMRLARWQARVQAGDELSEQTMRGMLSELIGELRRIADRLDTLYLSCCEQ